MNYFFTSAGLGSRILSAGIKPQKPFVKIKGKECLRYAVDSFCFLPSDFISIGIPKTPFGKKYTTSLMKDLSTPYELIEFSSLTRGQLDTAHRMVSNTPNLTGPLIIHNCDTSFSSVLNFDDLFASFDIIVPYFRPEGSHWSFLDGSLVDPASSGRIIVSRLAEKKRISDYASIGTYAFSDAKIISTHYDEYLGYMPIDSEMYIAPFIDFLVNKKGLSCVGVEVSGVKVFGTVPEILSSFGVSWSELLSSNDSIRGNQRQTLVCDIDETLCMSHGASFEDYSNVLPYDDVVRRLRRCHEDGVYIVLSTSRNMRSFNGNLGLINRFTLPTLLKWLEKHCVPFDEIVVGKPWGQNVSYIDDKALLIDDFISSPVSMY